MPEGVTFYKGCAIVRSHVFITQHRGPHRTEVRVPLYYVKGTVLKSHDREPLLTSVTAAKHYITAEINNRTYGS